MLVYRKFLGVSKVTFETAVAIRLHSALRLLLFREIPTKPTSQLEASHYVGSKTRLARLVERCAGVAGVVGSSSVQT